MIDHSDAIEEMVGMISPGKISPISDSIYKMLSKGYSFTLAPALDIKDVDENGNITESELLWVSLLTNSARQLPHNVIDMKYVMAPDVIITTEELKRDKIQDEISSEDTTED